MCLSSCVQYLCMWHGQVNTCVWLRRFSHPFPFFKLKYIKCLSISFVCAGQILLNCVDQSKWQQPLTPLVYLSAWLCFRSQWRCHFVALHVSVLQPGLKAESCPPLSRCHPAGPLESGVKAYLPERAGLHSIASSLNSFPPTSALPLLTSTSALSQDVSVISPPTCCYISAATFRKPRKSELTREATSFFLVVTDVQCAVCPCPNWTKLCRTWGEVEAKLLVSSWSQLSLFAACHLNFDYFCCILPHPAGYWSGNSYVNLKQPAEAQKGANSPFLNLQNKILILGVKVNFIFYSWKEARV